ncbi:MAG: glycine--tRNA ligase subunit beta, partial [Alphaproteobacteria bacterium]|nr:glycine--tRNA ligase subunit beta [Alphaproteobacteria bacterium]
MADLLLELFSEEIPARMQADAELYLGGALEKALGAKPQTFVTPRRLAAIIENLPETQPDINEELKGPKVGAPEAAMQGFLKKTGLTIDKLEQRDGVYFAKIERKGRATSEVLKELIEKILAEFPWPKSMRWGSGTTPWVRPLHSILCIFDGKIVPIEFAGVKAGDKTRGHRFLAPAEIIITDPKQYESALENAKVIADRDKRKAMIAEQLKTKCTVLGVSLHNDPGLLEEVTGLVEWPVVLSGKIDASYMDLPEEVLILEMKNHQKYFATREPSPAGRGQGEGPHPNLLPKGEGALSPHFLITSNMVTKDGGKAIVAGNERVLRARFADGRFFYDQDRKTTLEGWAKKLEDVTYHAKLGSVGDKVARIKSLSSLVFGFWSSSHDQGPTTKDQILRAAALCKADLTTGMVGEFPELQGVMGRYYANHENLDPEIADAIRDHYKPQGPGDSVPTAPVSICVALADKLDTLISMFAIGEKPTGSKDPFALRRAALGVIRIILENNLRLPLLPLLQNAPFKAIATHQAQEKLAKETAEQLQHPKKIGKYLSVNEIACSDIP